MRRWFWMVVAWGVWAQGQGEKPVEAPKDPLLYLYNSRLDAAGLNVEKAAGAIANGAIFETQLENLKVIGKREMERIFASQRRAALARIEGARRWGTLYLFVEKAKARGLESNDEKADWQARMGELKAALEAMPKQATEPEKTTAVAGEFLLEAGRAQEVLQTAKFLMDKKLADVTKNDLRVVKRLQEGVASIGANLKALAAMPVAATSRSAEQKMRLDLIVAEQDYLRALGLIEGRRQAGQKEVAGLVEAVENALSCTPIQNDSDDLKRKCTLRFEDSDGEVTTEEVPGNEEIERTLGRLQASPEKLKVVVYLLQNFAALSARAETPVRLAELRSALEERRWAIRKDAIFAREYEQIFLLGAQRLALYGKGGVKPEALAALVQAAMTAGLIPAVALK